MGRKSKDEYTDITFTNNINPQLVYGAMADIIGRRHGIKIKTTVRRKTEAELAADQLKETQHAEIG